MAMFENISVFFKRFIQNDKKELVADTTNAQSKDAAKERLHVVLMQDRANVSADFLELMKEEILDVIKKYIVVDESKIDVRLTNQENEDGSMGVPLLHANIPILNIRNDIKSEYLIDDTESSESNNVIEPISNDVSKTQIIQVVKENVEVNENDFFEKDLEKNEINFEENILGKSETNFLENELGESETNSTENRLEESETDSTENKLEEDKDVFEITIDVSNENEVLENSSNNEIEEIQTYQEEIEKVDDIVNVNDDIKNTDNIENNDEIDDNKKLENDAINEIIDEEDDDDDVTFDDLLKAAEEEERLKNAKEKKGDTKEDKKKKPKTKTTTTKKKTKTTSTTSKNKKVKKEVLNERKKV